MRTTLFTQTRDLLLQLRSTQARRATASLQVASGLRVNKPSDSPADAAGIVRTKSELARLNQFRVNLETAQAELRSVDGALSGAGGCRQPRPDAGVAGNEPSDRRVLAGAYPRRTRRNLSAGCC